MIERSLEGARSLSSRTVIRDAILDYKAGKIDLKTLKEITQSKYEDGAAALEYLLKAERFVNDDSIAIYTSGLYEELSCTVLDEIKLLDRSSVLYLTADHEYYVTRSPILSKGHEIGQDMLFLT
ncbi:hypothetical protein MASR2M29_19880 [Spirochaetota bacterium]